MHFEAVYAFDLSEFGDEDPIIRIKCRGDKRFDGSWLCSFEPINVDNQLVGKELRAIKKAVYPLFQNDIRDNYGSDSIEWEGEKKRHPLLQFKAGDTVKYSGENHEVVYVIPETEKCGIKTKEGKLLNNIKFSEIQGVLLKKVKSS